MSEVQQGLNPAVLQFSYNLFDARSFKTAGAALFLDLAGRAVACASAGCQTRGRGQVHLLFVDSCSKQKHTCMIKQSYKHMKIYSLYLNSHSKLLFLKLYEV